MDNLGLDVTLSTISRIVASRSMDLVVTFQVSDLKRNAGLALTNQSEGERWNRFSGTDRWRQAIADYEARKTNAPDVGAALGDFYAERLMKLGYKYREQLERPMTNTRNAPLYRVMFFSKHPLGKKLFSAVSRGRQRGLF